MSDNIHRLPVRFRPRIVEVPATCPYRDQEIEAAEEALDEAVDGLVLMRAGTVPEAEALSRSVRATEAMLFHLMMAAGAREADRDLIALLAKRQNARDRA